MASHLLPSPLLCGIWILLPAALPSNRSITFVLFPEMAAGILVQSCQFLEAGTNVIRWQHLQKNQLRRKVSSMLISKLSVAHVRFNCICNCPPEQMVTEKKNHLSGCFTSFPNHNKNTHEHCVAPNRFYDYDYIFSIMHKSNFCGHFVGEGEGWCQFPTFGAESKFAKI